MTAKAKAKSHRKRLTFDALAGAMSGCLARFAVGPLDVLKIRFQVQVETKRDRAAAVMMAAQRSPKYTGMIQALRTIVREEGIQGLWRGTLAGQLLYVPYAAIQFTTMQQFNSLARDLKLSNKRGAYLVPYVSGAAAGAAATCVSYPFDILRTTLAAQGEPKVYNGLRAAAQGIVDQRGFLGLYRGLGITLVEIVPYSALNFGLYDGLNSAYNRFRKRQQPTVGERASENAAATSLQHFLCGLAAGTLAKLGTHPLDVAKKRFQVAGLKRAAQYGAPVTADAVTSLPACLQGIWAREGARGLYKGILPSCLKSAPSTAVTFATYELCIRALLRADAATEGSTTHVDSRSS